MVQQFKKKKKKLGMLKTTKQSDGKFIHRGNTPQDKIIPFTVIAVQHRGFDLFSEAPPNCKDWRININTSGSMNRNLHR